MGSVSTLKTRYVPEDVDVPGGRQELDLPMNASI